MDSAKENKKFYFVMTVSFLIMVGFGFLPPFGAVTPLGMRVLGILLGTIFGWIFGYNAITAVMALVICGVSIPTTTVDALFNAGLGAAIVFLVFWALIFVYGLNKCGILSWVSSKILSLSWCAKSPWHLAVSLWFCTIICCAICTQPFATTLIMFSLYYKVAETVGAQKRSPYSAFVLVFICGFSAIAIGLVPYASTLMVALSLMLAIDPTLSYNLMMICGLNWLLVIGMFIFAAILAKILLKTIIKPEFTMDSQTSIIAEAQKMDKKVKLGFVFIAVLIAIMLIPTFLPAGNLKTLMSGFGMSGMFAATVLIMSLVTVDGERFLVIEDALYKGAVNWNIYFIMGSAFAIGGLLVSPDTGIFVTLQSFLNNIIGDMGLYTVTTLLILALLVLTNCITNIVAAQIVIPIITTIFLMKGLNPSILIGMIGIIFDFGLVLPSGSPLGAFIHGNSEWMSSGQCYKYGVLAVICLAISIVLIGVPIGLKLL